MARENIVLQKGDEHTFTQENIGKYKIVAHIPDSNYTDKTKIFTERIIEVINPTPIGNMTIGGDINNRFLTGTDTPYFSILYSLTPEYNYTIDELNEATYTYIKDWNNIASDDKKIPVSDRPDENPIYFGRDSNGIFALLDIGSSPVDIYNQNNIYIQGDNTYIKAYVKGTCSIIDVDYSDTNNFNMIPSIAYPLTFNNNNGLTPYLFINSSIELLKNIEIQNQDKGVFTRLGTGKENTYIKCQYESNLFMDAALSYFEKNNLNYILKFAERNGNTYNIRTTSDVGATSNEAIMMISGGTNRNLIIPETVKKISHFYGGSNVSNIILPSSLIEIGESAFEGISGGAITLREYNDNLKVIGRRAFSDISNVRLFEYNINDKKTFIIDNLCSSENNNYSTLNLDREQLSSVLDTLYANSQQLFCLLPRVEKIEELAFSNAKNSTTIRNIIFSNIITSVGRGAFANAEINNLIIPDNLIARPESSEKPDTILSFQLLYLPERAIDLACRNLDLTYKNDMKDTIQIQQYGSGTICGYEYNNDDDNLSWLNDDKYNNYKDLSLKKQTFAYINQSSTQNYYFIHKASE